MNTNRKMMFQSPLVTTLVLLVALTWMMELRSTLDQLWAQEQLPGMKLSLNSLSLCLLTPLCHRKCIPEKNAKTWKWMKKKNAQIIWNEVGH